MSNQGGILANMDGSITNNDDFMSYHDNQQMQRIPGVTNMVDGDDDGKFAASEGEAKPKVMVRDRSKESGQNAQDSQGQTKAVRTDAIKATRMPPSKSTMAA